MVNITAFTSVDEIAAQDWDRLANPSEKPYNPFISHAFFKALETSKSAIAETGWLGQHLVLEDDDGKAIGLVPVFLKSHSYGEYVFDHGWADAYRRAGGRYYPKLLVAVPFTPVIGPRLFAPDPKTRAMLAHALISLCQTRKASSVHVTFLPEEECEPIESGPWLKRTDLQFHWHNKGYGSFHDFLADLSSRKRKNIRKERAIVAETGIELECVTGNDLRESHWDAFFSFYMDTGSRKWGSPYLTRTFFSLIGETMKDQVLLVMAKRGRRYIAGALNFIGSDALYGRNWGAIEHHDNLHFEACYYQAMEFAIANKLARVEAGAQGPHKLARGYLPQTTHSMHYLADPRLAHAVEDYLNYERAETQENSTALAAHSPFRHDERDYGA